MSLLEAISSRLLKTLPRERFLQLRSAYHGLKKRAAPLLRTVHGTFTVSDLIEDLDKRLDDDWSILMIHSSANGLAPTFQGSLLELLGALREYVGPDRTLVMPAFYFGEPGESAYQSFSRNPRFNLRRTPSQMGLLTELFRRSKGVLQSHHPVYRVSAAGPHAEALVRGHERSATGMGEGTPFDYMARHNAQILGIGKTFQVMTQAHHVESLSEVDWPAPTSQHAPLAVTLVGKDFELEMSVGGTRQEWRFNIWKLRQIMPRGSLQEWRFHGCEFFSARAGVVTAQLIDAAARGIVLYDPQ